jgi:biopolymer transport protein ExbD
MASLENVKGAVRVDMTPMVDLGFLLITFFVMTTSLSKPKTAELIMPDESPTPHPVVLKQSLAMNVIVGRNKFISYTGVDSNNAHTSLQVSDLRRNIEQHKLSVANKQKQGSLESTDFPYLLFKMTDHSYMDDLVNMLDEVSINKIEGYAFVDANSNENIIAK